MTKPGSRVEALSNEGLLNATRELVRKARGVEAELLVHPGEIDERKLYLERPFPSMFAFCCDELGFSEDAAYSRILVARAGRLPEVIEALRSGAVHQAGLRLLVPHLTTENRRQVLAQAAGKSETGDRRARGVPGAAATRGFVDPEGAGTPRGAGVIHVCAISTPRNRRCACARRCDGAFQRDCNDGTGADRWRTACDRPAVGGDVQDSVHGGPLIQGQAAAGSGSAAAPGAGRRYGHDSGDGTRFADRSDAEGAVRGGAEEPEIEG